MRFTQAERAIYYPQDRRCRIWIRPAVLLLLAVLALVPLIFAWLQLCPLHRSKARSKDT